ncbi:hypothetical protein GCM10017600_49950 [Streptosporangium carneum]|uniref:Uncharacterized protein n=1 Tax=Streptosporangium carneum TaxID=47481 RepID=A0A9W6I5K8_9ACTN|nr:hypothetical protein GCM10017600_49950 [Streptosporangium carneum]
MAIAHTTTARTAARPVSCGCFAMRASPSVLLTRRVRGGSRHPGDMPMHPGRIPGGPGSPAPRCGPRPIWPGASRTVRNYRWKRGKAARPA